MLCCGIGKHLLDKDQAVPAATDTYQVKYRFYFEEFTAQTNSFRVWSASSFCWAFSVV